MARALRPRSTWLPIVSLALAAWSLASCGTKERNFAAGTGGGAGLGGSSGGTDGGSGSGGGGPGNSGGSGGQGGEEIATGGAGPASGGTGGSMEPESITCGETEYATPTKGAWACETFDGPWPPEAPWSFAASTGDLVIVDDLFFSAPNSMRLSVPSSDSPDAKLSWSNTAGGDITELRLELELMQNSTPAAPPPWSEPLTIACVDFGQTEGCLLFQWGNGGYGLRITNYQTIPQSEDCDIPGAPTTNSWTHVVLALDAAGDLTFELEGEEPVVCSRGSGVVGTVASVWVGMEGDDANRSGYSPRLDDVFVRVTRE
jgi:hypothetical protein